jgi:hypothetical protein
MIESVYGVDFSGAKLAGRTTWLARMVPAGRGGKSLRLVELASLARLCGSDRREEALAALVRTVAESERALWAINFPFGLPVEVMVAGCRWAEQFDFLAEWGGDAYAAGVECLRRAKRLGGPMHVRRQTDREERTPFDAYHYRIIFQTFHGMRDVLGPLRSRRRTAILPFHARRLPNALRVVVESCPASTLKRLGLPHHNYKQPAGGPLSRKRRRTRRAILAGLAPFVRIPDALRLRVMRDPRGRRAGRDPLRRRRVALLARVRPRRPRPPPALLARGPALRVTSRRCVPRPGRVVCASGDTLRGRPSHAHGQ